jgi:hypothetical protein
MAEKRLREAIEKGEFDNLPGKGEPIDLRENPFEDPDLRVVHRLLRNAGFAPAWIEERKDIDASLAEGQTKLTRAWSLFREDGKSPSGTEWARSAREFRQLVEELNQRIRIYNLKAPSTAFHRHHIEVERIITAIMEDAN